MSSSSLPFLLVPGLGGQLDGYDELKAAWQAAPHLAPAEVITMGFDNDRPMHRAADYLPLFERLAPTNRDYVIVANSFGCQRAYDFARSNPPGLKALVFISGFLGTPHRGLTAIGQTWLFQAWNRYPNFPSVAAKMHRWTGPYANEGMRRQIEQGARPKPAVMRARVKLMRRQPTRLPSLDQPSLILNAEDDMLLHPPSAHNLRKSLPGAKVVTLPGPHFIPQAQPVRVAEEINAFLEELCR